MLCNYWSDSYLGIFPNSLWNRALADYFHASLDLGSI